MTDCCVGKALREADGFLPPAFPPARWIESLEDGPERAK